jgi:hypothetical protein
MLSISVLIFQKEIISVSNFYVRLFHEVFLHNTYFLLVFYLPQSHINTKITHMALKGDCKKLNSHMKSKFKKTQVHDDFTEMEKSRRAGSTCGQIFVIREKGVN